jgi:hypothetical protein
VRHQIREYEGQNQTAGARGLARSEPSGKLLRMPRTFSIKVADLPNMVDAIFAGITTIRDASR